MASSTMCEVRRKNKNKKLIECEENDRLVTRKSLPFPTIPTISRRYSNWSSKYKVILYVLEQEHIIEKMSANCCVVYGK